MAMFDKAAGVSPDEVTYDALQAALKDGQWALVDVREIHEFEAGHVSGSLNMPLSGFEPSKIPTDKPVVLICRSGVRSATALQRARSTGLGDIRHYRGGVIGWANEGGELV